MALLGRAVVASVAFHADMDTSVGSHFAEPLPDIPCSQGSYQVVGVHIEGIAVRRNLGLINGSDRRNRFICVSCNGIRELSVLGQPARGLCIIFRVEMARVA